SVSAKRDRSDRAEPLWPELEERRARARVSLAGEMRRSRDGAHEDPRVALVTCGPGEREDTVPREPGFAIRRGPREHQVVIPTKLFHARLQIGGLEPTGLRRIRISTPWRARHEQPLAPSRLEHVSAPGVDDPVAVLARQAGERVVDGAKRVVPARDQHDGPSRS